MGNLCAGQRKEPRGNLMRSASQERLVQSPPRDETHGRLQKQVQQRSKMSDLERQVDRQISRLEAHMKLTKQQIKGVQYRNCITGARMGLVEVGSTTADIATGGASLVGTGPGRAASYATGIGTLATQSHELNDLRDTLEHDISELQAVIEDYATKHKPDNHLDRAQKALERAQDFKSSEAPKNWRTC